MSCLAGRGQPGLLFGVRVETMEETACLVELTKAFRKGLQLRDSHRSAALGRAEWMQKGMGQNGWVFHGVLGNVVRPIGAIVLLS